MIKHLAEGEQRQWEIYRQIRHIILYRPILPWGRQQTDALQLDRWIHQEMTEPETHERSFQEVSLEEDSHLSRTVTRMLRRHLVYRKDNDLHRLHRVCMIGSLTEKGIRPGVRREEIENSRVEI